MTRLRPGRALARRLDLFVLVALAGCGSSTEQISTSDHALIGQCVRNEATLRGPAIDCAIDSDCACGSFCDTVEHTCKFECMVPPGSPAESCATGTQCDDTGRCVAPNQGPPGSAPALSASPASLTTAPGGAAKSFQVRLATFTQSAATAAQTAQVRAVGVDGAEVSCDASTFGHECTLSSWTFSFDGTRFAASKPLWVRTATGTPIGDGEVHLQIDDTSTDVLVPTVAASTSSTPAGDYRGTATSGGVPTGVPITAKLRGNFLVVRDPSRSIAPDGAVVVNVTGPSNPSPFPWRLNWLRPPGATTGDAIIGEFLPITLTYAPDTGSLTGWLQLQVLDGYAAWQLRLTRTPDVAECTVNTDCQSGWICPNDIRTCVPQGAWGGASSIDNQFDDPRSAQWFNAIDDVLGVGDGASAPFAFQTTGADLIESLMCTTATPFTTVAGRLGVTQIMNVDGKSHSGDLACVRESDGFQNLSPGAVGLTTRYDRKGSAPSAALLNTCLTDLARPVTAANATNFSVNTGDCVNLARALPALRLLGMGELSKRTSVVNGIKPDLRLQGLFRRLVQQWSHLHGFIASTGLGQREFEDATTGTPAAARQNLLNLLDVMDAGWSALLDQRVAPAVETITSSEDGSDESLFWPQLDYRFVKQPVAYWPFNAGSNINIDIMQGAALFVQKSFKCSILFCPDPPTYCQMLPGNNYYSQAYNCPGYGATLPATGPSISGGGNLSVLFNIDPLDVEFPTYSGGTIVATDTLAVIETWATNGINYLNIIHPTGNGTTEWVPFTVGPLGHWTSGPTGGNGPSRGTTVGVVRDSKAQTYTVYVFNGGYVNGLQTFTMQYQNPVQGSLALMGPGRVLVGAGPLAPGTTWWGQGTPAYRSSYGARIDDVAIWNSMLSKREFSRIATARGYVETGREFWPANMTLTDYGTQELKSPVAADLLAAQVAHLELADRLAVHMRTQAQAACDNADATARADVDTMVARLGRTLRQSTAIQSLVANADSDSANANRALLGAKTSQLLRDIDTLVACHNPYGMSDTEVPLYFGSISPATDERAAFFAASDHLLNLAEQRAQTAQTALDTVRTRWDQARQSQIQQLQDDNARSIRVDELTTRYGGDMIRLCGMADVTPAQIIQEIVAGTFSVDTCFIKPPGPPPTNACPTSSTSGPIMDADPTCYRGTLGGALMDMRAAYHAQQAAYNAWQAAIGNAEGANRLCVLKEMDVFGCSAVDRHALSGVTCPAGHQGTLTLIEKFNQEMHDAEEEKGWFDTVVHTISTAAAVGAAVVATGGTAAFLIAAAGALSTLDTPMSNSMEDRKRAHEAMLQSRALIEDVRACWNTAEQYERAIAAAEEASKEATSRMQSAIIAFENGVSEAREVLATAPVELGREINRPSIPIAFHYWLPEALETYQFAFESARRYAYMALRAVEYDTLDSYTFPQSGKPSRGAVLGSWLPPTLTQQLALMRDQTNTRQTIHGPPSLGHMTFDLGAKYFGLIESSPDFGASLAQYARPVYSSRGEYLGLGVRFSLVPQRQDESPTWRCAERIWRVNVGATGFPSLADGVHVKLLKRNLFASRRCDDDSFQVASLRPSVNLLIGGGEPGAYVPETTSSAADVRLMDFNQPDALFNFKNTDNYLNGSSSELSLQELYGDYVLLFPATALSSGLVLSDLRDFFLRFDFLSIDNTPPLLLMKQATARASSPAPIVVP